MVGMKSHPLHPSPSPAGAWVNVQERQFLAQAPNPFKGLQNNL